MQLLFPAITQIFSYIQPSPTILWFQRPTPDTLHSPYSTPVPIPPVVSVAGRFADHLLWPSLCSYSQEITQISLTPHLISQLLPQALPGNTPAMLARESGGLSYLSIFSANSNPGVLTPSL